MWKSGWGNFKKMEGEGWRRILCGGAVGKMWNGGGYCAEWWRGSAEGQRRCAEWWRGIGNKVERWCGMVEDIVWRGGGALRNGGEGVRRGYWGMGTRWRGGAEWRRGGGKRGGAVRKRRGRMGKGEGAVRNGGGRMGERQRSGAEWWRGNAG